MGINGNQKRRYARQKLLNSPERIVHFHEVSRAEVKAFTGFDEMTRIHKIQKQSVTSYMRLFNCGTHAAHAA